MRYSSISRSAGVSLAISTEFHMTAGQDHLVVVDKEEEELKILSQLRLLVLSIDMPILILSKKCNFQSMIPPPTLTPSKILLLVQTSKGALHATLSLLLPRLSNTLTSSSRATPFLRILSKQILSNGLISNTKLGRLMESNKCTTSIVRHCSYFKPIQVGFLLHLLLSKKSDTLLALVTNTLMSQISKSIKLVRWCFTQLLKESRLKCQL